MDQTDIRVLLVAPSTGCIYELIDIKDDAMLLENLSIGGNGWVHTKDFGKLVVSMRLTRIQIINSYLIPLIKESKLKYEGIQF